MFIISIAPPADDSRAQDAVDGYNPNRVMVTRETVQVDADTTMFSPARHQAVAEFFAGKTRRVVDAMARRYDIPLLTMR